MTSRELTFGHVAVMHLPMKFGADIFIQYGVIDVFLEIKYCGRSHLGFVWVSHGTTHEASSFVVRSSCKIFVIIS